MKNICDLSKNKELAKSLANYVNALAKDSLAKDPVFDYAKIMKTVYDKAESKNKDSLQALGIVYNVPKILLQVIEKNPELNQSDFIKKGYDPKVLYDFIEKLEKVTDPFTLISETIKNPIPNNYVAIAKVLAEQAQPVVVKKVAESPESIFAKKLEANTLLAGTGEQALEEYDPKTGNLVKISDKTDPVKNFINSINIKLLNVRKDALNFDDVTYDGKKGFKYKAMMERDLPKQFIYTVNDKFVQKNIILAITDNKGNFRYFKPDGTIGDETNGRIVYSFLRNFDDAKIERIKNNILSKASPDLLASLLEPFNKKFKEEKLIMLKIVDSVLKGDTPLLKITGGSLGVASFDTKAQRKLSEFKRTPADDKSIITVYNSKNQAVPGIVFGNSDPIPLKGYKTIGETDPKLIQDIATLLTEDVKLLGEPLKPLDIENYIDQFMYVGGNKFKIKADGEKLIVTIGNNIVSLTDKEAAKKTIQDFLNNKSNFMYVRYNKNKYHDNEYTEFNLIKQADGTYIAEEQKKEYIPYLFDRVVPEVSYDQTTGGPMIINSYLSFSPDITIEEVRKENDEINERIKDIDIDNLTQGLDMGDLNASKLLERKWYTPNQKKAVTKWWKQSPLSKATYKDENGQEKPLLNLNLLRDAVNSDAYATFRGSSITLYKGSKFTDIYHEAWHAFSQLYLTYDERTELYDDVRKTKGSFTVIKKISNPGGTDFVKTKVDFQDATRREIEEYTAEEFRIYAMNGGKFKVLPSNKIAAFFKRIFEALKALLRGTLPTDVFSNAGSVAVFDELFNKLYNPKMAEQLKQYKPSINNAEFAVLNSGIINEKDEVELTVEELETLSASIDGLISKTITSYVKKGNYGAATKLLQGSERIAAVYDQIIYPGLNERLKYFTDVYEKNIKKWEADNDYNTIDTYKDNIRVLRNATKTEVFGNAKDILSGKNPTGNTLIAYHKQKTVFDKVYKPGVITLAENDLGVIDESNPKDVKATERAGYDKGAYDLESEKLADDMVIYLFSSLVKQYKNGDYVLNRFGLEEPINFKEFWLVFMNKVAGRKTIQGIYNRMKELTTQNISPYFQQLLDKLGDPNIVMDKSETGGALWLNLRQSASLQKSEIITNIFSEKDVSENQYNPEFEIEFRSGKSSAEYNKIKNKDWPSKFKVETGKFIKKNSNNNNVIDLAEVKKEFLEPYLDLKTGFEHYKIKDKNNRDLFIPFLNSIGLYVADNFEIKERINDQDIMFLADSIGHAADNKEEIQNIVSYFNTPHNFTSRLNVGDDYIFEDRFFGKNSSRVNTLAKLESDFSNDYSSQMKFTAENELMSTFGLNSTVSHQVSAINEVNNRAELYDKEGDYKHMSYLDPESNPNARGLIIMNSIFSTVTGEKKKGRFLELNIISGSQYHNNSKEVKGAAYNSMNSYDYFISNFSSLLLSGYLESIRASSKNTYLNIRANVIQTYDNKHNDNLYIDTTAYLETVDTGINGYHEFIKLLYPKLEGELRRIAMVKSNPALYSTYAGFEKGDKLAMFEDILETKDKVLKNALLNDEFLKALNSTKTRSLAQILAQPENKNLKTAVDNSIITYFTKLKNVYQDTMFNKYFQGKLPNYIKENILKELGEISEDLLKEFQEAKSLDSFLDTEKDLINAALWSYTTNAWLHKSEISHLQLGDIFQFNHEKDEIIKRTNTYQTPGTSFATDTLSQNYINKFVRRPYEQSLIEKGEITKEYRPYNGTMNAGILTESKIRSDYFDMYLALNTKHLTDKGYKGDVLTEALYGRSKDGKLGTYEKPAGGLMKPWNEIKEADGWAIIGFDTYRMLKRLEGKSKSWSAAQETLYWKIVRGETVSSKDVIETFPVYKLGYAGALATPIGVYPPQAIHKFSLFPLIPSVIKDSPLERIHKAMINQDMDYLTFESGSKRSHIKPSKESKGDKIFEGDTSNVDDDFNKIKFTKNPIYVAYLKNQTEVNKSFKDYATFSTQLRKLILGGLFEKGLPKDYKGTLKQWRSLSKDQKKAESELYTLAQTFIDRLEKFVKFSKKELLEEMDWSVNEKTGKLEGDPADMLKFIVKTLKKQGVSDYDIKLLDTENPGKTDISIHPMAPRIEKLLLSIVNNRLAKPKLKGEPLVQAPNTFSQPFRKPTDKEYEKHKNFGTNGLPSYVVDPNGVINTKGVKLKIALTENYENLFYTDYFVKNEAGEYVNSGESVAVFDISVDPKTNKKVYTLNYEASRLRLNEMVKVDAWRMSDKNREKITLTGVRIPTQGHNSIEFGEVWEFLKPEAGPIIIIPAEIVAKSGGDFDVDKLTIYMSYITKQGTFIEDTYDSVEQIEEKIKQVESKLKTLKADKLDITNSLDDFRSAIKKASFRLEIDKDLYYSLTTYKNNDLLKTLSEAKTQKFLAKNKSLKKALNIYNTKIKSFKIDEYQDVESMINSFYVKKSEISALYKELSDLKDHKRNFTLGISNSMIQDMVRILERPEIAFSLLQANDIHLAKPVAEELKEEIMKSDNLTDYSKSLMTDKPIEGREEGISPSQALREDYNQDRQQVMIAGKDSLGIGAQDNTFNALLNMVPSRLEPTTSVDVKLYENVNGQIKPVIRAMQVPNKLNLKTNKITVEDLTTLKKIESISLSSLSDADKVNSIADILSQLMNGFVDVERDDWVAYIQGNLEVVPKMLFLLQTGVPFKDVAYFVSNPMTRYYVEQKKSRQGVLSPVIYGIGHDPSPFNAAAEAKEPMMQIVRSEVLDKRYNANQNNMFGMRIAIDQYARPEFYKTQNLRETAISKLDFNSVPQLALFLEFLYVEELMKDYNDVKRGINFDTNTTPDLLLAKAKINELKKLKSTKTMNTEFLDYAVNDSIISATGVQDFARELFGGDRLFKLRDDDKINDFILAVAEDRKLMRTIKAKTGYDLEVFAPKFKNMLSSYILANKLKKYNPKVDSYKGEKISSLINIEEVKEDFKKDKYAATYTGEDSYLKRGLFVVSKAAFDQASVNNFIEFALEREYLRKHKPLTEELINTIEFTQKKQKILNSKASLFTKKPDETQKLYDERINNWTYENILANQALANTFNIWKLFRSGDNTIARELMDIKKNYPKLVEKYTVLDKLSAIDVADDKAYQDVLNLSLKNYKEIDGQMQAAYNNQLRELADFNKIKLLGTSPEIVAAKKYITDFFSQMPFYAYLQSGQDPSEFSLSSIIPFDNIKPLLAEGSEEFKEVLQKPYANIVLSNLLTLFIENNRLVNKKLRNRGAYYAKPLSEMLAETKKLFLDIEEMPYITEISKNVFVIDDASLLTKEEMSDLRNQNKDVVFIMNEEDLKISFNIQTNEELEKAKTNIDTVIAAIKAQMKSGTRVVISSEGFGQTVTGEFKASKPQTSTTNTQPPKEGPDQLSLFGLDPQFSLKKEEFESNKSVTNQVAAVKQKIESELPSEVAKSVTVLNEVPLDVLGRDDLFLSLKDVLNDNGITDEVLINWAGINKDKIGHPKSIKSDAQLTSIIRAILNKKQKEDQYVEFKVNPLALKSFKEWNKALEKYPLPFQDQMLTHAIKHITNPTRKSKYVLQLSEVALTKAYGMVVNKPHELNRIGKLYDQEVLATVSDSVDHEPSASGKGYWVHIPRTDSPSSDYQTRISDLTSDPDAPGKFAVEYMSRIDMDHEVDFFETEAEAEAFVNKLTGGKSSNSAQYKVNVDLLRKLSPSTWCTASSMTEHYVQNYDNYLLIVDGVTVAGIEASPDLTQNGQIRVKEVTSRANNGMAPIDHIDDVIAFFEKHNLDLNNQSVKRAIKAREGGKVDKDYTGYEDEENLNALEWDNYVRFMEEEAIENDRYEEARRTVQAMRTMDDVAANRQLAVEDFALLDTELRKNKELATEAIDYDSHSITHVDFNVPFYNELAVRAVTKNPYVFIYLSPQAKEIPGLREIYERNRQLDDDLPFSKTNAKLIQGYYDPKTDKVVVIASNTPINDASKVAIHEVAHRGMLRMAKDLGGVNELSKALFAAEDQLIKKLPELLKRTGHKNLESLLEDYGFTKNSKEGRIKLLMELAARWAETLVNKPKPSWWKEFLKSIKNWIAKFTGVILDEKEVDELVGGFVKYGTKQAQVVSVPETPQNKDLFVYLSNQLSDNFNYVNPGSTAVPSIKDLVNRGVVITQTDINNKKLEC